MEMNVAILGAGTIVPDFLLSASFVDGVNARAIFGQESDRNTMADLSAQYGIEKIYTNYDELLNDADVNTFYVALPNHLHYSFARQALEHGKHVILEKPFCSVLSQTRELFEIAADNNCYLFEAIPNIHFPNYHKIKEFIGKLGDIKIVQLNVSKYSRRYDAFKAGEILPAFDPKKDGGALMDMGVYHLHFLIGLFGKPEDVHYFPNIERGVDTSGIAVLQYPGFTACAIAAKDCSSPSCISIQGDKGYIYSPSTTHLMKGFSYHSNAGETVQIDENVRSGHERLAYEIGEFWSVIAEADDSRYEALETQTLSVAEILEKLRGEVYE